MKLIKFLFLIILVSSCNNSKNEGLTTEEPQDLIINDTIQPVAPEIFSKFKSIRDFTINSTEDEAYFTLQTPLSEVSVIMKLLKDNSKWSSPEITTFSGRYSDLEAYFSPDNLRLYFSSNRPVSQDSTSTKDFDIWYVERKSTSDSWSKPINVGAPVNTNADEFYPAITNSKNLYFTAITEETGPGDDIFISKWENNTYSNPEQLSDSINTKGAEFNAYVSPDESFILFSGWRRPDGIGSGDIYLSKKVNGQWQGAENLGKAVNSKQIDFCPYVNLETQTLYFTSRRSGLQKPDSGFVKTQDLMKELNRYDDGSSKIYKVDFQLVLSNL
ncbi:hypothetical protein [Winogradskyella sp. A3E31]|uniref:hypothetical protein n=1 Tax=Winogradskyella sp. A3E31 TaxID=3349637 RepID=UPI00398B4716